MLCFFMCSTKCAGLCLLKIFIMNLKIRWEIKRKIKILSVPLSVLQLCTSGRYPVKPNAGVGVFCVQNVQNLHGYSGFFYLFFVANGFSCSCGVFEI